MQSPLFLPNLLADPAVQRIVHRHETLPRTQQRIADYVLNHLFDVATLSIEELAQAALVSVASANRFARALGYKGYPDFRADILRVFKSALEPVEKLRSIDPSTNVRDTLSAVFSQSVNNLEATRNMLNVASGYERLARALQRAERLYVVGFGSSAFLAQSAAYHFDPYCANVHAINGEGGAEQAVRRINKLTAKDLVFGISFPRYSADTVRLLDFAQQRGASVVALTDGPTSPLVNLAKHILYAKADSSMLSNSNVSAVATIEALGAVLAQAQRDASVQARDLTEQLMPYFYFNRTDTARIKSSGKIQNLLQPKNSSRRTPRS